MTAERIKYLGAALFFAVLIALPFVFAAHWFVNLMVFTLIYAGASSAWNLVGGFAGYPSLGHAAFFGIGAYLEAIYFTHHSIGDGWLPFAALPVIGVCAAVVGLGVGAIAMRTRADVFAIVTITFLFVVQTLASNLRSLTGGSQGIGIKLPPFPPDTYERPYYFVLVALLALAVGVNMAAVHSKFGPALWAIRADEDRARGVGVPVTTVKLLTFSVSVGIVAMIGAVWAYYLSYVYPQFAIDPLLSVGIVLMAYLGGRTTVWGPVLGTFIIVPAQQYFAYQLGSSEFYLIAYAAVFLVIMLVLPRGILPSIADRIRTGATKKTAEPVPDDERVPT